MRSAQSPCERLRDELSKECVELKEETMEGLVSRCFCLGSRVRDLGLGKVATFLLTRRQSCNNERGNREC